MVDIKGNLKGPAGRLSNFKARNFVFHGVPCACPEALLQAFKFEDSEMQLEICLLNGRDAKARGIERNEAWQSRQTLWWLGREYPRHSEAYQRLLDAVYVTLSQIPEFQKDLLETGEEVLTHSIGESDASKTVLTEEEFCSRLMWVRDGIIGGSRNCLTLEEMNEAATMIEHEGAGAFQAVAECYGKETAQLLLLAHLRRNMGSTETYLAAEEIGAKVIEYLKGL